MWRLLSVSGLALTCATLSVWPARSQTVGSVDALASPLDDDSVLGRSRPEYDPQGLPFGAFRAYPTLRLGASFDDNVLRTDTDARSDYFVEARPQIVLRSQWPRHYLGLSAGATHYSFSKLTSENRTEWDAAAVARVDVMTGSNLVAAVSHNATFEPRTSRDQVGAAKPTPHTLSEARAEYSWNPFRFGMQLGTAFQRYDYGNTELVPALGGGQASNDDRDRKVYSIYTTALYEAAPGYGVFLRPSFEKRVYDLQTDRAIGRDSRGYNVDGGVNFLLTRLITGEAYIGYLHHDFEGSSFQDLSGLDYGAQLRWYPSELITVRFNASRTPSATTILGASVADDRHIEMGADYEVLRNVIVQGGLAYTNTQFDGVSRQDEDFSALLSVRYLLNSYLKADLRFARSTRDSTVVGQGFVDNILFIGLTGQL